MKIYVSPSTRHTLKVEAAKRGLSMHEMVGVLAKSAAQESKEKPVD